MRKRKDFDKKDEKNINVKEDNTTKYGEQVCSEFGWLLLDKQKENAEKFNKMTKKENK